MKILVDENMPYARELFSRLGEVKAVAGRPVPVEALNDADALMVRSVTKVNEALLSGKAKNALRRWESKRCSAIRRAPIAATRGISAPLTNWCRTRTF